MIRAVGDRARARSGRGSRDDFIGGVEAAEAGRLARHAVGQRILVELDPDDRAGTEELVRREPARDVAQRRAQQRHRQLARGIERDQRAAGVDELPKHVGAVHAQPANIRRRASFRRHDRSSMRSAPMIGQHDRVEALPQAALLDVGVGDVLELELVLFEQPPRPAFVDVLDPRFVEADAGAADRPGVGRRAVARGGGAKPKIARDRFHGFANALRFGHQDRSGRIGVALQRHWRRRGTTRARRS